MSKLLKLGSKVSFLNETGHGIIIELNDDEACVLDESGFETWYPLKLLVPFMSIEDTIFFQKEDDLQKHLPKKTTSTYTLPKNEAEWKIDLHMENLIDSHRGMTNHEIVLLQLKHFKNFLLKAENARIKRIIVVHGIGTGKLKNEIQLLVRAIKGAEMFDANYQKYGQGASVIERKYNVR